MASWLSHICYLFGTLGDTGTLVIDWVRLLVSSAVLYSMLFLEMMDVDDNVSIYMTSM